MTHANAPLTGILLLALALVLSAAAGGGRGARPGEFHIPVQETAREQFAVARRQQQNAQGVFDAPLKERELRIAIRAYEKVAELFPNDTEWTPVAQLLIGDLHRALREHHAATVQYQTVLQKYPEDTSVRHAALFGMGQALDELKRPQEAETYYRLLIEEATLSGASDEATQNMVAIARRRVRTIQVLR